MALFALALPPTLILILKWLVVYAVVRALFALGVGISVFVGFDVLLDNLKGAIFDNLNEAGTLFPLVINFLGLAQVDVAIQLVISAQLLRITFHAPNYVLKKFFIG